MKCIGCKWDCPSFYANQLGEVIPEEEKNRRDKIEAIIQELWRRGSDV